VDDLFGTHTQLWTPTGTHSDEQHLQALVASLNRWLAANLPEEVHRDRATVLGDEAEPRPQAQTTTGLWARGLTASFEAKYGVHR
jgi:hypothetical protein